MIAALIIGLVVVGIVCLKVGLSGSRTTAFESLALVKGGQKSGALAQLRATQRLEEAMREMKDDS